MIVEGWRKEGDKVGELTVVLKDSKYHAFLTKGHEKIWEYETVAQDPDEAWIEAMTKWHEFNEWEPYKPMEEKPKMKTLDIAIDVPSGKLVFANHLWDQYPEGDDGTAGKHEGSGHLWNKILSVGYGREGCLTGYVGNSCPGIYQDGDTIRIASARCDEEYEPIPGEIPGEEVGSICTDLWWFCAADHDDLVARGADVNDRYHDIIDVEPGRYVMRYNYEGVIDSDDPGKPAIYATICRSDAPVEDWKFPHEGMKEEILALVAEGQANGEIPKGETYIYIKDMGKPEHRYPEYRDVKRYEFWGMIGDENFVKALVDEDELNVEFVIKELLETAERKKVIKKELDKLTIKGDLTEEETKRMGELFREAF